MKATFANARAFAAEPPAARHENSALAAETMRVLSKRIELYERAARFHGRPRERMVALAEADDVFFRLHEQHYRAMQAVRVASQMLRPVRQVRDDLHECEDHLVRMLSEVIHEAIRVGDLALRGPHRPDELAFTVWALAFGVRALSKTAAAASRLQLTSTYRILRGNTDLLFDS